MGASPVKSAQDLGEAARDLVDVVVGEASDLTVDAAFDVVLEHERFERVAVDGAEVGPGAIGEDDVGFEDVVEGFAVDDGVGAAGVVADAAADGCALAGDGVGGVHEAVLLDRGAEVVVDDTGLDACPTLFGVDLDDVAHVLGEIDDDGVVGGLACEAGAATARHDGHAEFFGGTDNGLDVIGVAGDGDADGDHLVHGGVGGVQESVVAVHADLTGDLAAQAFCDGADLGFGEVGGSLGRFVQQGHAFAP
jgi:hypothetical protein